ncbi:NUDIX domain-containing protein [Hymenobacter sp. AT01-02]|uniref:NUDIX domain-containing protein n=1 Tax=Hymenobacter sp. AT01-02 TaxID=1571877 RepID=UPI000AC6EC42|nr:NUDIX domain-containing protein [Hymenobacter sp. AT01-02]
MFGLAQDIAAPASRKVFQQVADTLIPADQPAEFNQAIMEFGAIQCTPVKPDCLFCPLQSQCYAFQHGLISELPVKSKAKAGRTRYFHYFVLQYEDTLYMRKRGPKDIWEGLYDFALHEADSADLPARTVVDTVEALGGRIDLAQVEEPVQSLRHVLSHQKVEARFHPVKLEAPLTPKALATAGLLPYKASEIESLPKSILITNYISNIGF